MIDINMKEYVMRGDYNRSSEWQLKLNLLSLPILNTYLKQTAASLPSPPLRIGDFGCSAGRNSITLFNIALEELRHSCDVPVSITHEDLPSNRWELFFRDAAQLGYLDNPNLFVSIIGKSFYKQVHPSKSLHLGYSACAMHYLSRQIDCPDHIVVYLTKDEELREKARLLARSDMITILQHRANEIVAGGHLILNNFIYTGDGKSPLEMLQSFNMSLKENEIMTEEEIERMTRPTYMHTVEEWRDILNQVMDLYSVKVIETHDVRCPYYETYLEHGDREKFSGEMMEFFRTWHEGAVRECLKREQAEVESVVNAYFERLKMYVYENLPVLVFSNIIIALQVL
jgi:gibberellin A4 carboxyl methyltransferase